MSEFKKSLGYFSMDLNKDSVKLIKDFCDKNDIPVHDKGLHTTVIYDENAGKQLKTTLLIEEKVLNTYPVKATIVGTKLLGENKDVLVLLISCMKHAECFNRLLKDGYHHSYPDYQPHMTIVYDATPEIIKTCTEKLKPLVGTEIYFNIIKVDYIDND